MPQGWEQFTAKHPRACNLSWANTLVQDTVNPHFVNHKGKSVNSDRLADQRDVWSVLGYAQIHKGRTKGHDPEIDTVQTPKRLNGHLALMEKIWKKSIPNKPIMNKRTNKASLKSIMNKPIVYWAIVMRNWTSTLSLNIFEEEKHSPVQQLCVILLETIL